MKRGIDLPTPEPERSSRAPWALGALALAGGYLAYRIMRSGGKAAEGHSPVASVRHGEGIKVTRLVTIAREPAELYAFWRDFANLPRFMPHLEQVEVLSPQRSRWTTAGPLGKPVTWEAVIHNDVPNELIAWRTIEPADIPHAGSVRFTPAPAGRGTEVRVTLEYAPPLGGAGAVAARLLGVEPGQQVADSLRRLKSLMETGSATPIRAITPQEALLDAELSG
jgi:uncharacterized membrane protein